MNKNRMEAFSDGVFAIVITLLVLEIKVPHVAANELKQALIALLPKYFSFALSFIIIGVYWISHHNLLHYMVKTDRTSLWLNMVILFAICILPYPTALIGDYPDSTVSIIIYGSALIFVNLSGTLFWVYCTRKKRLCEPNLSEKFIRKVAIVHTSPCILYLFAMILSVLTHTLSYLIFILVPLFFIIPNRFLKRLLANAYDK